MARTNPISERDLEIAKRLVWLRKDWKFPRSFLASLLKVDLHVLVRIELGRVPLKYGLARRILQLLAGNPLWLATNSGERRRHIPIPSAETLGESETSIFSEVFDRHLSKLISSQLETEPRAGSNIFSRYSAAALMKGDVDVWFRDVPDGYVQSLSGEIKSHVEKLLNKWPSDNWERILERRALFNSLMEEDEKNTFLGRIASQKPLTPTSNIRNTPSEMKSALKSLLDKVRKFTEPTGMKAKLAADLKVPQARVSEWLSGKHDPSGETTLRLLQWVEQRERS